MPFPACGNLLRRNPEFAVWGCIGQAPASSLVQHSRALAEQLGPAAAKDALGGYLTLSDNAARHLNATVLRFGMAVPVPISEYVYREGAETFTMPYLRPRDYLETLLRVRPHLLFGGYPVGPEQRAAFVQFWASFKEEQPSHAAFQFDEATLAKRLRNSIPLSLHGDGGRTAKRQPLQIISLEPTLGILSPDSSTGPLQHCRCAAPAPFSEQRLNQKENSYLTRFLLAAFPGKQYPAGLLVDLWKTLSTELADLFWNGICYNNFTFYPTCIGLKGDMEFHAASLPLDRSFRNLGTRQEKMICIECEAGKPEIPWEDCNAGALWEATCYRSHPWRGESPFSRLPFEDWHQLPSRASCFFRRDAMHVFRLGLLASFRKFCAYSHIQHTYIHGVFIHT